MEILAFFVFVVTVAIATSAIGYGLTLLGEQATSRRCRRPHEALRRGRVHRQRGGADWKAFTSEAHRYHSGCQGTYSRTFPSLLDFLARSRNTANTSSFFSSSLAVVFVPSHSDSIQRTVLDLAPVVPPSASLTPLPLIRSHLRTPTPQYQPSIPSVSMHDIHHVAYNSVVVQDVGVPG